MKRSLAFACAAACGHQAADKTEPPAPASPPGAAKAALVVTSAMFAPNGAIPPELTCTGADRSPPLAWTGAPSVTKSFAVIVDDPDAPDPAAPKQTWVHWVLAAIPPTVTSLRGAELPPDVVVGTNDWGKASWGGPCPPIGRHRYFFKVYALDAVVGTPGMTKAALLAAAQGHVVGYGELVGTYQKP